MILCSVCWDPYRVPHITLALVHTAKLVSESNKNILYAFRSAGELLFMWAVNDIEQNAHRTHTHTQTPK